MHMNERARHVLRELCAKHNTLQPSGMFSWLLLGSSAIMLLAPPPAASAVRRRDDCVRAAALGREAIRTQFAAPRAPRPQLARDDAKLPPTQSMWARAAATEVADP